MRTAWEARNALLERVGGGEQITRRFQAEYAYNLEMKGFTWDIANGAANPTDSALGTSSNWDQTAASIKDTAAVMALSL